MITTEWGLEKSFWDLLLIKQSSLVSKTQTNYFAALDKIQAE
jgi:hypothetical protein